MVDMTKSRKPVFLGGEFDAFLFAPIAADGSGTFVTLVSLLARLDLDPWDEAAKLTRLTGAIATQKLAALISRFPEIPRLRVDAAMIAARLTALLPGRLRGTLAAPQPKVGNFPPLVQALLAPRFMLSLLFILMSVLFALQLGGGAFHPAGEQGTVPAAQPATVSPHPSLPGGADAGNAGR